MSWDSALAYEFVDMLKMEIKEVIEDHDTDDPYTCANDIGKAVLDLVYEYYGGPEDW